MYYEAARDSLVGLLSSTSPERAHGKILLTDSESILLLTNYISFTILLELGFLDVIVLDRLTDQDSYNPALSVMQTVVVVSNLALVDQRILGAEAAKLHGADRIKSIDLIVLRTGDNRLIPKLLRYDENGPSRINRLYFSTVNYFSRADGMFYCQGISRHLPSDSADWTGDDFRYVHDSVEALINVCGNALECTREKDTDGTGQLIILTPTTGKTSEVVANLVNDAWKNKTRGAPESSSNNRCCLVILDRSDDPVVPCLLPWTYLGMIEEYLKLDASGLLTLEDGSQANLSFTDDSFFRENYNRNYGDLTNLLSNPPPVTTATLSTSIQDFERAKKTRSEFELHSKIVHQITEILNTKQIFAIWKVEQAILQAASITRNEAIISGIEELTSLGTVRSSAIHRLIKLIKIKCRYILEEDYPNAPWIQWTPEPAECPLIQALYQKVAYKVANRIGLKNSEYIPLTHRIISYLMKGQMPPKMVSSSSSPVVGLTMSNVVILMIGSTYVVEGPQKTWKTVQVGGLYPQLLK